ncbi:hypothetical protein GW813_09100 [bacterium]|nr:hypothetical protein [bacterium]
MDEQVQVRFGRFGMPSDLWLVPAHAVGDARSRVAALPAPLRAAVASRPAEEIDDGVLVACTRALLDGTEPPVAAEWDDIEAALRNSEPEYPSLAEAMSALRGRPWSEDE